MPMFPESARPVRSGAYTLVLSLFGLGASKQVLQSHWRKKGCRGLAPGPPEAFLSFPSPQKTRVCAGFTLLEALVALIIVSIALGVLFQVVSGSLNLGFRGREQFVVTAEAMAVFDMVAPQSLVWEELEWSNSTETGEWTMTLHPVIIRDSFERTGIAGGRDLFKLVFEYEDLGTGRKVRLFSYRREEQDRLRVFLEKNKEHVIWDEYDQFAEYITP